MPIAAAALSRPFAAASSSGPEGRGEPGQDHLCLGVAEPCVALEQDGPIGGEHQPGIERATERGAAPGQLREQRPVEPFDEVVRGLVGEVLERTVGTHPTGVRPGVEVAQALVVAGHGQRQRFLAIADGDQARLTPLESLLDDDRIRLDAGVDRRPRLLDAVTDGHALAGGEPVGFHDDPAPLGRELAGERERGLALTGREGGRTGHRDTGGHRDVMAERLARLDPRGGGGRTEDRDPGLRQRVGETGRERRLRADHDQLGGDRARDERHALGVEGIDVLERADARLRADRMAPRGDGHLVDAGLATELPRQRVLASTAPDDQDAGRHDETCRTHAGTTWRWRTDRHARSMVWVRSGPTETSTIGTPAWSSSALT